MLDIHKIKSWLLPIVYGLARLFYGVWPRSYPKKSQVPVGINFMGYYAGELGLGQALRSAAFAARSVSLPFTVRKLAIKLLSRQHDDALQTHLSDAASFSVNCISINPDMLYRLPLWVRHEEWAHRYNVGYWFWELASFPASWSYADDVVDEIWVNTDFVAQALATLKTPVFKIPFAIAFEQATQMVGREQFALPCDQFIFLFSFDFHSQIARKNPQAVIAAFQKAFSDQSQAVMLVIKTSNGAAHPEQQAYLEKLVAQDPRMMMIDAQFSTEKMRGLLSVADCYISLHRAEGLGLGMAESMYLGKPVIATAYSGNMEFMNSENAALVPYDLIPVEPGQYPFWHKQVWAEPNVSQASNLMHKIVSDATYRNTLSQNAARYMREHHSYERMGHAMQERLAAIAARLPS